MKPKLDKFARKPFRVRGFRSRTAALFACLAISTCAAVRLDAVVIDDFAGPVKFLTGYFGTNSVAPSLTNGQLVLAGQFPGPLVPGNPYLNLDNIGWSNCFPAVSLEGRTLELRMDLVRASADDVFLVLAVETTWVGAGYAVMIDQNEVALFKYGGTVAAHFWTDAAVTNQNVTVSLSLTRLANTMLLTTKVLDKGNGRTLFERSFVDTPGSDVGVLAPPPKGMTIFVADPGVPYTSFTTAWAGVWDLRATTPPPIEVVLDNLEYDLYYVPHLEIAPATNGVALNWMLPMEEHIVVEVDQLAGPWCPCPQPHARIGDAFCLQMPCLSSQKFFKLTPGRQFTDDFSNAVPAWRLTWNESSDEFIVTNDVLRLNWNGPTEGGFVAQPPEPDMVVVDFCASADILDWTTSGTNWSVFSLVARAGFSPNRGYFGALTLNAAGIPGNVRPWIYNCSTYFYGPTFDIHQSPPPYRLQFSGVGSNLLLRVLNPATGASITELSVTDSTFADGWVGLWINAPSGVSESHSITVDKFFATGTKP